MWFGNLKNKDACSMSSGRKIVFAFGIQFSHSEKKLNFSEKLDVLEKTLNNQKRRNLTLLGKINIVKSVGVSRLIYNISVLLVLKDFCHQFKRIISNFIRDKDIAKIKKIIAKLKNGSLNMIEFPLMKKALKSI